MRRLKMFSGLIAAMLFAWASPCPAQPVTFHEAVELALQHGGLLAVAEAGQQKAYAAYLEARGAYLPTIVFGSGLGYSNGIPLTIAGNAPSLFNINSQQALINFAQKSFLRAAKNDWDATRIDISDKRSAVILDAATAYLELNTSLVKLKTLGAEAQTANHAEFITSQRLKEGLDSDLDLKKAQLNVARVNLRMAESQTAADIAREHLARLTGLAPEPIETVDDSIPATPAIQQQQNLAAQAAQNSLTVRLAESRVVTAELRAQGEQRALYPSIDLASQYAVLARFNNYAEFYKTFQRNNFTIGISLKVPFTDFTQHARANAAVADLVRARQEVEIERNQVEEAALKMQRSLRQLAAATEVARLEYDVAQAAVDAVSAKLATGEANVRDQENARMDVTNRYATYLDSQLELSRATLQLLRQTGELDGWALPSHP